MNVKNVVLSGIVGGFLFLIVMFAVDFLVQIVAPYDIFSIGGMRSMEDPLMFGYFLSPFLTAVIAAIVFDVVGVALKGTPVHRGLVYGGLLILLLLVPDLVIIYTSMLYPAGFYLSNILTAFIAYPLLGVLFGVLWAEGD
jgi:hypothetical protein